MNRRIPILSLLVVMTMVMAACGPNTDEADESEAAPESEPAASAGGSAEGSAGASAGAGGQLEASGDIFAYGVSYETSDEIAQGRVDHFSELYPDVNVSFSESGFESQGFLTAL